jgi:hypothetical protein
MVCLGHAGLPTGSDAVRSRSDPHLGSFGTRCVFEQRRDCGTMNDQSSKTGKVQTLFSRQSKIKSHMET